MRDNEKGSYKIKNIHKQTQKEVDLMNYFQPYGGGVDSKALKIIMLNLDNFDTPDYMNNPTESVFCNPGSEMQGTVEDIHLMNKKGWNIRILKPNVKGFDNIYDYYFDQKLVPMFKYRSCTDKFKHIPQRRYYKQFEPYTLFIGYDYTEMKRIPKPKYKNGKLVKKLKHEYYKYPLVDMRISRRTCKKIIAEYGETVPVKSGCFFCIYQSPESWYALMRDYSDLFWKAVALEENCEKMNLVQKGTLRSMYPPPQTFQEVDMGCRQCMFGLVPEVKMEDQE